MGVLARAAHVLVLLAVAAGTSHAADQSKALPAASASGNAALHVLFSELEAESSAVGVQAEGCAGTGASPGTRQACYVASRRSGVVSLRVRSFAGDAGVADVHISGGLSVHCVGQAFTLEGQSVSFPNLTDCLPVEVKFTALYCASSDSFELSFVAPVVASVRLLRATCPSTASLLPSSRNPEATTAISEATAALAQLPLAQDGLPAVTTEGTELPVSLQGSPVLTTVASCSGSGGLPGPACYVQSRPSGTLIVHVLSFKHGAGVADVKVRGILNVNCPGQSFNLQGHSVNFPGLEACLPALVRFTAAYCPNQDSFQLVFTRPVSSEVMVPRAACPAAHFVAASTEAATAETEEDVAPEAHAGPSAPVTQSICSSTGGRPALLGCYGARSDFGSSLTVRLLSFEQGAGLADLYGTGVQCPSQSFTLEGQSLEFPQLAACLPPTVRFSASYCPDQDSIMLAYSWPLPVMVLLSRIECQEMDFKPALAAPATVQGPAPVVLGPHPVAAATCSGAGDLPAALEQGTCYSVTRLSSTFLVKVLSYQSGTGLADVVFQGRFLAMSCTNQVFTFDGRALVIRDMDSCLSKTPLVIHFTLAYCSDQDAVQLHLTAPVPLEVSLERVQCTGARRLAAQDAAGAPVHI